MTDTNTPLKPARPQSICLDSSALYRRSLEASPTRSSVQSSCNQSRAHTPSSSVPNTPLVPTRPPSPEKRLAHPSDSNSFLTALAAQERKVLELKEEVQKAEAELGRLKKQWAAHEASKKKNELRHVEQMQPLKASHAGLDEDLDDEPGPLNREMDRRKRLSVHAKTSQRTVFSGSRHTRTLSLLSPKEIRSASPSVGGQAVAKTHLETVSDATEPPATHGLATSTDGASNFDAIQKAPSKDAILETGKQLVGDFRQGLWTFLEDLRQVTVGDEAANAPATRTQHHALPGNTRQRLIMKEKGALVRDNASRKADDPGGTPLSGKQTRTSNSKSGQKPQAISDRSSLIAVKTDQGKSVTINSSDSDEDSWDNWDTPKTKTASPRRSDTASTADTLMSPLTDVSSARTSMR